MTSVAITTPVTMTDATLSIAGTNFEDAVTSVKFTPTSSPFSFTGISGKTVSSASRAKWTLDFDYVQDLETAGSLANYLQDHETENVPAILTPTDGGPTYTATVTLVPGEIGGGAAAMASTSVSLQVTGVPVRSTDA